MGPLGPGSGPPRPGSASAAAREPESWEPPQTPSSSIALPWLISCAARPRASQPHSAQLAPTGDPALAVAASVHASRLSSRRPSAGGAAALPIAMAGPCGTTAGDGRAATGSPHRGLPRAGSAPTSLPLATIDRAAAGPASLDAGGIEIGRTTPAQAQIERPAPLTRVWAALRSPMGRPSVEAQRRPLLAYPARHIQPITDLGPAQQEFRKRVRL